MEQILEAAQPVEVVGRPPVWMPKGTQRLGVDAHLTALINIIGKSGVGKSHLVQQLIDAADYGPDEVLVLMAEDATSTYNREGINIKPVSSISSLKAVVKELVAASREKQRLPKAIFWDSMSGTMDYQRRWYDDHPGTFVTNSGARDRRAEFGDMGYGAMDCLLDLRDKVATDVIVAITSHEGREFAAPEIAVEGKLTPRNLTRLSSVTLYMKAETKKFSADDWPPERINKELVAPHRTISRLPDGTPDGTVLSRVFITQDTGEIMAKGHHSLQLREPAYLPAVLRKIHGVPAPQEN